MLDAAIRLPERPTDVLPIEKGARLVPPRKSHDDIDTTGVSSRARDAGYLIQVLKLRGIWGYSVIAATVFIWCGGSWAGENVVIPLVRSATTMVDVNKQLVLAAAARQQFEDEQKDRNKGVDLTLRSMSETLVSVSQTLQALSNKMDKNTRY